MEADPGDRGRNDDCPCPGATRNRTGVWRLIRHQLSGIGMSLRLSSKHALAFATAPDDVMIHSDTGADHDLPILACSATKNLVCSHVRAGRPVRSRDL